ncbi:MAG: hypothetical protein ABIG61_11720 [Planctomycetota bacterium]
MKLNNLICGEVREIYRWIDEQVENFKPQCKVCGRCCDFDSYGHRLYVTGPEVYYLRQGLGAGGLREMTTPLCPYNEAGRCTVHDFRFAGCRIFFCRGDPELQNRLSEQSLQKFKDLCIRNKLSYRYRQLKEALSQQAAIE